MWDERYAGEHYFYGTEPNRFLVEQTDWLKGPVLSIAEGEGRNAVYMASLGLKVCGVDSSKRGIEKTQALAEQAGVEVEALQADLAVFEPQAGYYGSVVAIFAHLPTAIRVPLCQRLQRCLKPGGTVILEAYSEAQINNHTGGPKDLDLLLTTEKVRQEFAGLNPVLLRQINREVVEGEGHTGLASVVQYIGQRGVA